MLKTQKPQLSTSTESDSLKLLFSVKDQYPIPMLIIASQTSLMRMQQLYDKQHGQQNDSSEQTIRTSTLKITDADIADEREKLVDELSDVSSEESTAFDGNE